MSMRGKVGQAMQQMRSSTPCLSYPASAKLAADFNNNSTTDGQYRSVSDHDAHSGCALRSRGDDCRFCGVRHLSICQALNVEELVQLEKMASDSVFEERAVLFREEDEVSSVFNVTAGVARLIRSLPDGRRQVTGFALPGDF